MNLAVEYSSFFHSKNVTFFKEISVEETKLHYFVQISQKCVLLIYLCVCVRRCVPVHTTQ